LLDRKNTLNAASNPESTHDLDRAVFENICEMKNLMGEIKQASENKSTRGRSRTCDLLMVIHSKRLA